MNKRLNDNFRLWIRKDSQGIAIPQSGVWRLHKPAGAHWIDVSSCVVNCCNTNTSTSNSFIIFQGSTLATTSHITAINFPGYSWSGSLGNNNMLIVPLPFDYAETITVTCLVTTSIMNYNASTVQGTGTIGPSGTISPNALPQTFTLNVTKNQASQYLILLTGL